MNANEIRTELRLCTIRFEQALDSGVPSHELKDIYRNLKELQYQLTLKEIHERNLSVKPDNLVIE